MRSTSNIRMPCIHFSLGHLQRANTAKPHAYLKSYTEIMQHKKSQRMKQKPKHETDWRVRIIFAHLFVYITLGGPHVNYAPNRQ